MTVGRITIKPLQKKSKEITIADEDSQIDTHINQEVDQKLP